MQNDAENEAMPHSHEPEETADRHVTADGGEFDSADTELGTESTDLLGELSGDEEELLPPEEENEAREINVGNIFAVIMIFVVVVILIVVLAGGGKKKKKGNSELDKAGSKFEVEFKEKSPEVETAFSDDGGLSETKKNDMEREEDVDKILETLPSSLQPQPAPTQAPVAPVGSRGGSARSDRPDTRNSKSPRKIDGLKGQGGVDTNQNIVSAVMNGSFTPNGTGERMTKEEYIAQMMKQTQNLQNQLYGGNGTGSSFGSYGGGGGNQAAAYQQNKEQFYSNGMGSGGSGEFMSYNSLWDGTIISGALITAINTDNPGVVIARVTENVYSSYDHSFLLIPEGSLLYATYNSSVSYGQDKVQVAWNLLIRPDGYRIVLGNMNGVSAQGVSGYKGRVNNHPFETLKALGMIAIYSMIQTEVANDINSQNNEYLQNAMTDVYTQAAKIGNKIIDRALDIKPTITIKAGTEIKLITNTPLELPPVQINQVTRKYVRTR